MPKSIPTPDWTCVWWSAPLHVCGAAVVFHTQGTDEAATAEAQQAPPAQAPSQPQNPAPEQQPGSEVSTAAAKLVAEIVASPVFYLVAGERGEGGTAALHRAHYVVRGSEQMLCQVQVAASMQCDPTRRRHHVYL